MENNNINSESNLQEKVFEKPAVVEKINLSELKAEQEKFKKDELQTNKQKIDAEQEEIKAEKEERQRIAMQKFDEAFERFKKSFESLNDAEVEFLNKKFTTLLEKNKKNNTGNKTIKNKN